MDLQNSIHFILQGKGGIGKSFVSALLAQWLRTKIEPVYAYDTDQVNTTFAHYKALGVEHVPVTDESLNINTKLFDGLMEKLVANTGGTAIIDNGANTFTPLLAYMVENGVVPLLQDVGMKVYIHTIVGGGDTLRDTAGGFKSIVAGVPNAPIILWANEHFGPLVGTDGKPFHELKVYRESEQRIAGSVVLVARNHQTFGADIKHMNNERVTFDEVLQSSKFALMEKQRLQKVKQHIFEQLDAIEF